MNIEIWSDIACPWCYVGKRRFEQALESFEHRDDVTVTWRSFELDPTAPAERPESHAEHLADKYGGGLAGAQRMLDTMTETAAAVGLDFDFANSRGANTFDGHRLIHFAAGHGKQDEMKERLLKAYFSDGELVSDHDTLVRLAGEIGLDEAAARDALVSGAGADEVREDEHLAQRIGIRGVPFFVADRQVGVSGAQEPEVMLDFLRQAWERRPSPIEVVVAGDACGPDGC
jgi:predicted DsbA family dithiol-disulfide isomerase